MNRGFQATASGYGLSHAWGATPRNTPPPVTCPAMLIPSISKPATVRVWARLAAAASPLDEAWEVTAAAAGAGGGRAATGVAAVGLAPASALRRLASILRKSVLAKGCLSSDMYRSQRNVYTPALCMTWAWVALSGSGESVVSCSLSPRPTPSIPHMYFRRTPP